MPEKRWRYRAVALRELERHGVRPHPTTPPGRIHEYLESLYAFEIRELKIKRKELERFFGPQPLEEYAERVKALKASYPILSLPPEAWAEEASRDERLEGVAERE
jgi:hypothetical protein